MIAASAPVVCFGEMLLRLSPLTNIPLARTRQLGVEVGGAEANVAAALASLGRPARMISAVPDSPLGQMVRRELASARVDTSCLVTGAGRMGLYFYEAPSGPIAGRVTYDRVGSVFAQMAAGRFDFVGALEGAAMLHMSGVTPALGSNGVDLARAAQAAAKSAGVPICFDGNYRANLWDAWDSNPREILHDLVGEAQILIGNHRDISLLLGKSFSGDGPDRRREAAEAAFDAFPNLQLVASTARQVETGQVHRLSARVDRRLGHWQTEEIRILDVVDRIGSGDAFAAGLLLSYLEGMSVQEMAKTALALAVMKHGVPGDMITVTRAEIDSFNPGGDVRR